MISLEDQIQMIAVSILFGIFFMFIWSILNRIFFKKKKVFLRWVAEILLFILGAAGYFILLLYVNDGQLTIYLPIFLLIGVIIYQYLYAPLFLKEIEKIAVIIDTFLTKYVKTKIIKLKEFLRVIFCKVKSKFKRKKKVENSDYDWSGFVDKR